VNAAEVLKRYKDEDLPAFCGISLIDVNQVGLFGERPLAVAAVRGDVDEIRALIEGGADVKAAGELGNTALHEAVRQENLAAVGLLLQFEARANLMNESGQTALDIARMHGNTELVSLLENTLKESR
jgi:ankyrin repeat protein